MMEYTNKYWNMLMPFIKKSLNKRYGKAYTKALIPKADAESGIAEEFIDDQEIKDTLAYADANKDNTQSVEDYRNGKEKAIGFLVGQTMKAMKGKANPGMVNKILKELL